MSSYIPYLGSPYFLSVLHLLLILLVALFVLRLIRSFTSNLIKPVESQNRAAKFRIQQIASFSEMINQIGSALVWTVALFTALPEFGIEILPAAILLGVVALSLAFGARDIIRDFISGFSILLEEQFNTGDTIQVAEYVGRVEQFSPRRTVLRDSRGALLSLSNGDLRNLANLNRDWSQAFIDVSFSPEARHEKCLHALEVAAEELRSDTAWVPSLIDGPRILGIQSFDRSGTTIRVQVRTAPNRQDEVSREFRRRVHAEFQKQNILPFSAPRFESSHDHQNGPAASPDNSERL